MAQDSRKRQADMKCVDEKLKCDEKIMPNPPNVFYVDAHGLQSVFFPFFYQQIRILCFIISSPFTCLFILQQIRIKTGPCEVGSITY